jgi:hypothetical protein
MLRRSATRRWILLIGGAACFAVLIYMAVRPLVWPRIEGGKKATAEPVTDTRTSSPPTSPSQREVPLAAGRSAPAEAPTPAATRERVRGTGGMGVLPSSTPRSEGRVRRESQVQPGPAAESVAHEQAAEPAATASGRPTITLNGIEVPVELGKRYRIVSWGVGTWNPRPRTPEEDRRLLEIGVLLRRDPPPDVARVLWDEIHAINAQTERPGLRTSVVWLPAPGQKTRPPESEEIVIDLRNR